MGSCAKEKRVELRSRESPAFHWGVGAPSEERSLGVVHGGKLGGGEHIEGDHRHPPKGQRGGIPRKKNRITLGWRKHILFGEGKHQKKRESILIFQTWRRVTSLLIGEGKGSKGWGKCDHASRSAEQKRGSRKRSF